MDCYTPWVNIGDHDYFRMNHNGEPPEEEQLIDIDYFRNNNVKVTARSITDEELENRIQPGQPDMKVFVEKEEPEYLQHLCKHDEESHYEEIEDCNDNGLTPDVFTFHVFDPAVVKIEMKPDIHLQFDEDQKSQLQLDDIELVKPDMNLLPLPCRSKMEHELPTISPAERQEVFPMQASKCSQKQCPHIASSSIFPNSLEITAESGDDDKQASESPKKKMKTIKTDRYAVFTDGETCWNPSLDVFQQSFHPIPNLERPAKKFRFYHQQMLRELVKESLRRQTYSAIHSRFEQKCLHLGVTIGDVELFRRNDYDIELIKETWFSDYILRARSEGDKTFKMTHGPALLKLVMELESKVDGVTDAFVEDLIRDPKVKIDWLFVSAQMLFRGSRNVSEEACERLWNNVLSPNVLPPHRWTQQHFSKLKMLVTRRGKRNFQKIAKEMGKEFTAFLCMKLFVRYIRPALEERVDNTAELRSLWSRQHVQEDFRMTMEMYNGSFRCTSDWMSLAYGIEFPVQFLIQQCEKYRIGQLSIYEDCILIVTDEIIRTHNLAHYTFRDLLPWRPSSAWSHRLFAIRFPHCTTTGGKNEWTENEDRLLLKWAKRSKRGWKGITKHFQNPRRSRKSIQSRYMVLLYKLRKQSLEQFHASRRESTSVEFYYMRKALCLLQDIEEVRRGKDAILSPEPVLVRNLFQRFHAFIKKKHKASLYPSNYSKQYPQQRHLQAFLLELPSFYVQQALEKMRGFLAECEIDPTLPP